MMKRIAVLLLSVTAFLAGLLSTSWILGRFSQQFDEFAIRQKLLHFAEHRDEYDTLFLGSSRVYHQISPAIFDEITRDAGRPTRSFNMAMDGLFPPEDSYLFEYIRSLRPNNLRWVFVELSMFLPKIAEENANSPRSVYWHDWTRTSMAIRDILDDTEKFDWKKRRKRSKKWRESFDRCVQRVQLFARNVTSLGEGGGTLSRFLKGKEPNRGKHLGPANDGFAPLTPQPGAAPVGFNGFDKLFASRLKKPVQYKGLSDVGQENLDRLLGEIRKTGATPILVVSPVLSPTFVVPKRPMGEPYLDFADVHTWSDLYRKEHFVDAGHLTPAGAELYTRYIAQGWLAANGIEKVGPANPAAPTTSALDVRASIP